MRKMKQGQWTAAIAQTELARWAKSGLSMRAYSEERGYPAQRLSWWRRRLGTCESSEVAGDGAQATKLVEATLVGFSAAPAVVIDTGDVRFEVASSERVSPSWLVEVVLGLAQRG